MSVPEGPKKFGKKMSLLTSILSAGILVFVALGVLPPQVIPVMEGLQERHMFVQQVSEL